MDSLDKLVELIDKNNIPSSSNLSYYKKGKEKSINKRIEGNQQYMKKIHDDDTHMKTLELYNQSAALAESNSEELALAFSNRSALLFHLKKYEECLVDIEKVNKITNSILLKKKIADRKEKCLTLMKNYEDLEMTPNETVEETTLMIKPSKTVPCASKLVSLEFNEKYGRHIVAKHNIKPGTIVAVEKSCISFPDKNKEYLRCSHCLNFAWNAIPCATCACVIYCSEKCKEEAWSHYHDIECCFLSYFLMLNSTIKNGNEREVIKYVITFKIFIKFVKQEGLDNIIEQARKIDANKDLEFNIFFEDGLFQSDQFKTIYSLCANEKNYKEEYVCFSYYQKFVLDKFTKDDSVQKYMIQIIKKLKTIVDNNVFSVYYLKKIKNKTIKKGINNDLYDEFGFALTPFFSFMNHSCEPNITRSFYNGQIVLFTTNHIKKGEQLFLNYGVSLGMEVEERKEILFKSFNFICDCLPCRGNECPNTNFSEINSDTFSKVTSEFERNGIHNTFIDVTNTGGNLALNKKNLYDVKKMLKILCKYYYPNNSLDLWSSLNSMLVSYVERYYLNYYAFAMPTC